MMYFKPRYLRQKLDYLVTNRNVLESEWASVLRLVRPTQSQLSYFTNRLQTNRDPIMGQQYRSLKQTYDNHGATASLTLSSYLHSSLTNPHDDWMKLKMGTVYQIPDLSKKGNIDIADEIHTVQTVLQFFSDQFHLEWQGGNFHQEVFSFYKYLIDIGTSCLGVYLNTEVKDWEFSSKCCSMFNTYFMEDGFGRPNHVWMIYNWDAKKIVDFFCRGMDEEKILETVGEKIYKSYKKWSPENFIFVHFVCPNLHEGGFHSCYFLYEQHSSYRDREAWESGDIDKFWQRHDMKDKFLKTEKLYYHPYIISRIRKDPVSYYGSGYSMEAFPQLKQLQEMQRAITIAAQKNVEPPYNTPTERLGVKFSTQPNAKNPSDMLGNQIVSVEPSIPQIDLHGLLEVKESLKRDLDRTFLIDRIIIESTKRNRTATEVQKRTGEEIKILSPFIGSLENEFLKPLVKVSLELLMQINSPVIKDAFKILKTVRYGVKYVSDIALAQVQKKTEILLEFFQSLALIAERKPEVLETADWMRVAQKIADNMDVPKDTLLSPIALQQKVTELKNQLAKQQQMDNLKNIQAGAGAAKQFEEAQSIQNQGKVETV